MEEMSNYEWIELLPDGWHSLAKAMIDECMAADPTYRIIIRPDGFYQFAIIA